MRYRFFAVDAPFNICVDVVCKGTENADYKPSGPRRGFESFKLG